MTISMSDPRLAVLENELKTGNLLTKKQIKKAMNNALVYFTVYGFPPYKTFELWLNSYLAVFEGIFTKEQTILLLEKSIAKRPPE
jgi:hypothetical protein